MIRRRVLTADDRELLVFIAATIECVRATQSPALLSPIAIHRLLELAGMKYSAAIPLATNFWPASEEYLIRQLQRIRIRYGRAI